ncbi:MAG: hypothetical protein E3J65_06085 [Dehalococcoidia bacterium]|nr:MAG: hypothetical protein E3J65_06085 [Dehalococcoidia bacterium]
MEHIERYIEELEAIRNYPKVVKERDKLSERVAALEASLKSLSEELARYKELKVRLAGAGEISLDEARRDSLRVMDAEIEKRGGERFEALKREYETKMPHLVYQRLLEILKAPARPAEIVTIIRAEAEKKANGILYHSENWPDRFKEYYQKEMEAGVKSGLDSEFNRRVEGSAEVKARQRLSALVNAVWPAWFSENIQPRIAELERKANENAFQLLKGPWTFVCDRCGTTSNDELTAFGVEELVRKGQVQVECDNPACEDRSLFSTGRHRFKVSLHELIELYITGES